jgi:hypothetical protein
MKVDERQEHRSYPALHDPVMPRESVALEYPPVLDADPGGPTDSAEMRAFLLVLRRALLMVTGYIEHRYLR